VLADFGLISIADTIGTNLVTHTNHYGCVKFMAPELIQTDDTTPSRTPETDAYSLGSVCLEVTLLNSHWSALG
jgi:serine/threonine protein kinase